MQTFVNDIIVRAIFCQCILWELCLFYWKNIFGWLFILFLFYHFNKYNYKCNYNGMNDNYATDDIATNIKITFMENWFKYYKI